MRFGPPDTGSATMIAVVLGAVLATLGGLVATQLENLVRRRQRERNAALLFGEVLSMLEVILKLADASRERGERYGPLTMRMVRGARREMDIYDRNRESLYDLRDAQTRVKIHALAVRVTMALDGVIEATPEIAATEHAAHAPGLTKKAKDALLARLDLMRASREGGFDFALEMAEQIKPLLTELGRLAKHSFEAPRQVVVAEAEAQILSQTQPQT
jgi:hypothetical protein